MSETFEQAIERCLMDGTTAKALRLIAADFDDASDDCIDAIAIRQGADGLDTLVARVADLTASRDRASDACASVQKERDELREMLGNGVRLIERAVINTPDQYKSWHTAAKAFLARYEGEVK